MVQPARTRRRPLLVSALALFVTFAAAEVLLRLWGFRNPPASAPMLVWNSAEDELMASGAYLYQFDDDALWSPRPGAVIQFGERERIDGPPELVNADGFRGPAVPRSKAPGTLRIATLGDSSTFGVGVHAHETWTARLGAELSALGVPNEVINAGVEGYTITQGIGRYKSRVRPFRPDVVIAAFGAVNEHWPADATDAEKIQDLRRSSRAFALARRWLRENVRVAQAIAHVADPGAAERFLRAADEKRAMMQYLARFSAEPDWPFARRASVDAFRAGIAELKREVEADGARLILVAMPRRPQAENDFPVLRAYTRAVLQAADELDLQIVGAHARFRYAERDGDPRPSWFLHDYWHPSAAGHARIASWLAPLVRDPARHRGEDAEVDLLK